MSELNYSSSRILVVDDDPDVLLAARLLLKQHVAEVVTEPDPNRIQDHLGSSDFDAVMLDMNFTRDQTSGEEGLHWLKQIINWDPEMVVVMITAYGDAEIAVHAIKTGATDFVLKPWQNEKLLATMFSSLKLHHSQKEVGNLKQSRRQLSADMDQPFGDFIGSSKAMKEVIATIEKVAVTDANVLITGENGTGKELAARAVYRRSLRAGEVFVKVDMGSIAETLFESELFGHVKGAFTDAREDRAGRFEVASGGTLFLDEIGNIPITLQAKLLTVLQSRQVTRVGSNSTTPIDIRLISASNMPIEELVENKLFRQDLLYRINTVEIVIPPLRERIDDIDDLAEYYLKMYAGKYKKSVNGITPAGINKLKCQPWRGNIRELQHTLERAVIMSESDQLTPDDFPFSQSGDLADSKLMASHNLEKIERTIIVRVLSLNDNNISHAAEALGLTRTSLYRRMQKHGL